jgi:1-acyl-sn-glycerol-3-phosphate acyltransferase
MAIGFVYWAIAGLLITLIGSLLYGMLPKNYSLACGRFILSRAFRFFIGYLKMTRLLILEDDDLKELALKTGPMIVAPNHIALWDAVFIIAQIPELICIMKGSILRNPFLGGGARLTGYIPNDSAPQMFLNASHHLKKTAKLLYFPEGTRTRKEAQWLNPLTNGVALLAKYSSAPVFPVYIRSNSRIFEKGRPLFLKPAFPLKISITVGMPVEFVKGENVQTFSKLLEQHYIAELSKPHPLRRTSPNE